MIVSRMHTISLIVEWIIRLRLYALFELLYESAIYPTPLLCFALFYRRSGVSVESVDQYAQDSRDSEQDH